MVNIGICLLSEKGEGDNPGAKNIAVRKKKPEKGMGLPPVT
ncbi:hypothetical protein [Pedobacter gandavensis]|nr:hypothetical protein [Pedobacter gandavensis]